MVAERDPSLIWRPLSEADDQPVITPYQWIVHTAVDSKGPTNLHGYFEQWAINLESHTWLRWNIHEQFIPFNRSADANYKANRFLKAGIFRGAISTETEDDGNPEGNPWNTYQVNELIRFGVWLARNLGIPPVLPAGPYDPGMGYHSLHPMVWTNVKGKTCPGGTRIAQFNNTVLPGIRAALNSTGDDFLSALTDDQQRDLYNQSTKTNGTLDDLRRRVEEIQNEMFHFKTVDPDEMPVTGQRKNQWWDLLALPDRLDDVVSRLEAIEEKLSE